MKKVRTFSGVISHDTTKYIITSNIKSNAYLKLTGFIGEPGIGKTTLAEITAMALTCESPINGEPCLSCQTCKYNLEALDNDGSSDFVKKINMALIEKHKEMSDVVETIFKFQPLNGRHIVYILEEFEAISKRDDLQQQLLEEMSNIKDRVYVIIVSSSKEMNRALASRIFTFYLQKPSKIECEALLNNKLKEENLTLSRPLKKALIEYTYSTPRDIIKIVDGLKHCDDLEKVMSDYLRVVNDSIYIDILKAMGSGVSHYFNTIKKIEAEGTNFKTVVEGFGNFLVKVYASVFGKQAEMFQKEHREFLRGFISNITEKDLTDMMDVLFDKRYYSEKEAEFKLIKLYNIYKGLSEKVLLNISKTVAEKAKQISTTNGYKKLKEEIDAITEDIGEPVKIKDMDNVISVSQKLIDEL